jgi:hypothetical protein
MRLRFVLLALALAAVTVGAEAQVGLYLNPVVTHISIPVPDSGVFAFLGDGVTSRWFGGVAFGGYYDFSHQTGYDFGVDVRDSIVHGNNASLNSFLVAPRLVIRNMPHQIRPYVQLGIGAGSSKAELSAVRTTKFQYGIFVGADRALGKHVDFRVIELGYGSVTPVSSGIYNPQIPLQSARLLNLSTGFVFRFR